MSGKCIDNKNDEQQKQRQRYESSAVVTDSLAGVTRSSSMTKAAVGGKKGKKKSTVITSAKQKHQQDKDASRNPRDASIDGAAARDMGVTMTQTEAVGGAMPLKRKRADNTTLLPLRENQSRASLSIRAMRDPRLNVVEQATGDGETYKQIFLCNKHLHAERPPDQTTRPLQDLVRLRLLSPHALSPGEKQARVVDQEARDIEYMAQQLRQINHTVNDGGFNGMDVEGGGGGDGAGPSFVDMRNQPANTMILARGGTGKKTRLEQAQGKPSQMRLSLVFGPINYPFGFEKRTSVDHHEFVLSESERDQAEKQRRFFRGDPLNEQVPYRSAPYQFPRFRESRAANMERFRRRNELPQRSLEMVPRPDCEEVDRAYIRTEYRRRPRDGEQLCSNGVRCLFNAFRDPTARYVGRAFYTPSQQNNPEVYQRLPDALCIDCQLQVWTLAVIDNLAMEKPQCTPMNHFTVKVCEGEYGPQGMLPVRKNRMNTGIVGCVPFYDDKKRQLSRCAQFIDEVGMDF